MDSTIQWYIQDKPEVNSTICIAKTLGKRLTRKGKFLLWTRLSDSKCEQMAVRLAASMTEQTFLDLAMKLNLPYVAWSFIASILNNAWFAAPVFLFQPQGSQICFSHTCLHTRSFKLRLPSSFLFLLVNQAIMERMRTTSAKMTLSSPNWSRSEHKLRHQDLWLKSRSSDAVPTFCCSRIRWWWVTTWSSGQMRSTTWTRRMGSAPANASSTKLSVYVKFSRPTALLATTESSSARRTKSFTRRAVCATWLRF